MSDPAPPPGIVALLTPDTIAGVVVSVLSSFVSALQTQISGRAVVVSNIAAALLSFVSMPVAISRGYTWTDWLGVICLADGIIAGTVFMLISRMANRALSRSDNIADGLIDKFAPGAAPKDKP